MPFPFQTLNVNQTDQKPRFQVSDSLIISISLYKVYFFKARLGVRPPGNSGNTGGHVVHRQGRYHRPLGCTLYCTYVHGRKEEEEELWHLAERFTTTESGRGGRKKTRPIRARYARRPRRGGVVEEVRYESYMHSTEDVVCWSGRPKWCRDCGHREAALATTKVCVCCQWELTISDDDDQIWCLRDDDGASSLPSFLSSRGGETWDRNECKVVPGRRLEIPLIN